MCFMYIIYVLHEIVQKKYFTVYPPLEELLRI